MSKSPWGNIGAWAAEAERAEEEEREAAAKAAAELQAGDGGKFPSLKEAMNTKQKKKTKMTLQEFTMQSSYGSGSSRGLNSEEMLRLPTGPKERSPDEMQYGRLGGGFSNYGARLGSGGGHPDRTKKFEGRRSYGGFEDDNRRGMPRVSDFNQQPSRADGVDNWASMKKTLPEYNSGSVRSGKYSYLEGGPGGGSPADEVGNWAAMKKSISQPPSQQQSRFSSFGSGFSRAEPDHWTRNEGVRPRLVLDTAKHEPGDDVDATVKVNKPNPFGTARPREEVLAEKGLDWRKLDTEVEAKHRQSVSGSRSTSSQSSMPRSAQSSRSEGPAALPHSVPEEAGKQRPKVNPFGDAKPREVLLEQKGLDWKKIDRDLEHRCVDRPETEEENQLKAEIEHLKKELQQKSSEEQSGLHALIIQRERDLELLNCKLDDKVRYSQKIFDRQGSGVDRGSGFSERPRSRPGSDEEPRVGYSSRSSGYENHRAAFYEGPPSRPGSHRETRAGFSMGPPSQPGVFEESQAGIPDRPLSNPGTYEESRAGFSERSSMLPGGYQEARAFNYMERPRSRGTFNSWITGDDRRALQGGGGRGFFGSIDVNRSGSRW